MVETIFMKERITFLGNISGIKATNIHAFMEATRHHKFGGSYPNRINMIPDEEILARNLDVLAQAGISDFSPIVLCNSTQERAEAILNYCQLLSTQNGIGNYWIIDADPDSFAAAVQVIVNPHDKNSSGKTILESMTVINLGSPRGYDCKDQKTGIRIVALPRPLVPYPMHPSPGV